MTVLHRSVANLQLVHEQMEILVVSYWLRRLYADSFHCGVRIPRQYLKRNPRGGVSRHYVTQTRGRREEARRSHTSSARVPFKLNLHLQWKEEEWGVIGSLPIFSAS